MSTRHHIRVLLIFCIGIVASVIPLPAPMIEAAEEPLIYFPAPDIAEESINAPYCDENILSIMERITLICDSLGQNEVCYGNRNVEVLPRVENLTLEFSEPGDQMPLNEVRSLRLSTLNLENGFWGIAQLRLLLTDVRNLQDVELLLFGDVYVEDTAEDRLTITVSVASLSRVNLRSLPDLSGLVVTLLEPDQELLAVARSIDGTWIQVEEPQTGYQGWVFKDLLQNMDDTHSLDELLIGDASLPYWRPMQAFVFESGQSTACDNTLTDGMLIQTADGLTRITLLINEVTLELLPGAHNRGATAFLQSNTAMGMNIGMIEGRAEVTFDGTTYEVLPNSSLQIPLGEDGKPSGLPATTSQTSTTQANSSWLINVAQLQSIRQSAQQPPITVGGDIPQTSNPIGTVGITGPQAPSVSSPDNMPPPQADAPNPPPQADEPNPPPQADAPNPPPQADEPNPPPQADEPNPPPQADEPNPPPQADEPNPPPQAGRPGRPPHAGTPGPPPHAGTPGPPPHAGGRGQNP